MGIVLALSGCVTIPQGPSTKAYLSDLCLRYNIQWQWDPVTQTVILRKGGVTAKALVGSKVVVLDGQAVSLSSPLERVRNSILVPADFESSVIRQMEGRKTASLRGPCTIVVDAGHGGKDPGAISRRGLREKNINLEIAQQLREDLERRGFKVVMTRKRDEFISLERRTEIASQAKADLFVSIHANYNSHSSISGVEVYTIRELDYREKKDPQRIKNLRLMSTALQMDADNSDTQRIVADMLYDYKRAESHQVAVALSRGLAQGMDMNSRGALKAGYFVLRNTLMPAVLVEVGYLSNSKEEKQLANTSFRRKIAETLADNIVDYVARRWE